MKAFRGPLEPLLIPVSRGGCGRAEAARELGCDESETAFTETLKRIGKHKPIKRSDLQGEKDKRRKGNR